MGKGSKCRWCASWTSAGLCAAAYYLHAQGEPIDNVGIIAPEWG